MAFYNNWSKKTVFPNKYSKMFYNYYIPKKKFWFALLGRLRIEKDALILVTGDTGGGKSHLVGNLCFRWGEKEPNMVKNDETMMFIPKENFIIDPEEFAAKMITKEGQVLWLDEARRSVNRRNWFNSIQKSIIDRKNTNRKLFNIYFLCMPYEKEFDLSLSAHLTIWIWVKKRGIAEVYCRTSGKKGGTGLNIQSILDREEKYLKENPKSNFINPTIHPEYIGRMKWGKLNKVLKKRYDKLVEEKKATGDLTDEEKERYGIVVVKTPEQITKDIIQGVKDGKYKDKKDVWEAMGEVKDTDDKKLKMLNFYLKLEGWDTFNRLFSVKKTAVEDIWK